MIRQIGLIDIDSTIPNIALEKAALYHRRRGDEVQWNMPIRAHDYDICYVSCVFTWNRAEAEHFERYDHCLIGGTGYDLAATLPGEIEKVKARINYGFATRGCIRKRPFCVVREKEGGIRVVADLYDIWDHKAKYVVLLDNNILAAPDHFKRICRQAQIENVALDFNQGLDIRLMTPEIADTLKHTRAQKHWRFAFDDSRYEKQFREGADILKTSGMRASLMQVYVLVGFNDTIPDALHRISVIHDEYGFDPFVMVYRRPGRKKGTGEFTQQQKDLVKWVNYKACFNTVKWKDFTRKKCQ